MICLKKYISIISAFAVLAAMLFCGTAAFADNAEYFEFEMLSDNTVHISGYNGEQTEVHIPNSINGGTVTAIRNGAFKNNETITAVYIPNSVESVEAQAFMNCQRLESVMLGEGVTALGYGVFQDCISLKSVSVPGGVQIIPAAAFWNCTNLARADIADTVKTISRGAFYNCNAVKSIRYNGTKAQWKNILIEEYNDCFLNAEIQCTDGMADTKLQAPTAKLTENANGSFTISWNKIAGADKYEIYVDNGSGYKIFRTVTTTSTTTGTVPYGKKYIYKVKAVNSKISSVSSEFSNAVNGTNTKKLQAPTAKLTQNANGSFTISWNKIAGADKYEIYVDNGSGYKVFRTVTTTSTTTGTVPYGKKYIYKVKAVNSKISSVSSEFSNAVNGTNTKKLQAPTAKLTQNANGSFTISWNKIAGADKYEIYVDNGSGYKVFRTVTTTSTTTGTVPYGKKYIYKVKAVNSKISSVSSEFSNAVNGTNTKKLQAPTAKLTQNANGSFTISWNKIAGADKYEIYVDNGSGYKIFRTVTTTTTTTGTVPYGKKYIYKVKAVNSKISSVSSEFSNAVNGTNTKKLQAPTAKLTQNANGSFTISWNKIAGADKYEIYVDNGSGFVLEKTAISLSFTTTPVNNNIQYSYKIKAVKNSDSSASSEFSNTVSGIRK